VPNREPSRRTERGATYPAPPQELGRIITYVPDLDARNRVDVDLAQRVAVDTGVAVCLARCTSGPGGDSTRSFDGAPATLATVDRGAALVSPLRPQYPERLRAAGVTGRVVVRLVVDTLGRVEPASVAIRESAHDLFAQAVRAVIPSLRFVPAEAGGRRVRMLVDLPFEFRLND
jgi:protein TonB